MQIVAEIDQNQDHMTQLSNNNNSTLSELDDQSHCRALVKSHSVLQQI